MNYKTLGSSNLHVSTLSLGSWMTYEFMQEDDALAVIRTAIENGINFLDDARYNDRTGKAPLKTGYSEVLFGRLLRAGGWKRQDLIIANKLWYEFYPRESPAEELDGSLGRLQMDYLDLVYCEKPAALPVGEIVLQVNDLIRSGKLRAWGILNWTPQEIAEAHRIATENGLTPPCAAELAYSVLNPLPIEAPETKAMFEAAHISIVASYSLYGGLLSGKYNSEQQMQGRFDAAQIQTMREQGMLDKVARFVQIAQGLGCTPSQLALAYCLKNEQVASVLFGAKQVAQVQDNVRALELVPQLNAEVMHALQHLG